MRWQPIHKRKKLGLALLEEEKAQEITTAGLNGLFEKPELKPEFKIKDAIVKTESKATNEFVFMTRRGLEIARVKNLKELLEVIWNVSWKSVIHHINNDDFSEWFDALGYEELAENTRKIKGNHKGVIKQLVKACNSALAQEQQVESNFDTSMP